MTSRFQGVAEELQRLYIEQDEALRKDFRRSLPFQDGIFDRWERARRLGFAEGASIYNSAAVFGDVSVGEQSWVGPYVILDGSAGRLSIGAFCSVSAAVHIYTHDTVAWAISGGKASPKSGDVIVGDNCYIGSQTVIVPGTVVGERCVIGANSVVTRDLEAGHIYFGTPARKVGRVVADGDDVRLEYFSDEGVE